MPQGEPAATATPAVAEPESVPVVTGPDCGLCTTPGWSVQRRNIG
ncbi:hypothetical protein [Nocardia sp. alder85J]|nr:hypothetical protein [Nocardia sp. alder85J]MCX4092393.1 hypothetical protein [Nocardia sp. alder85J]